MTVEELEAHQLALVVVCGDLERFFLHHQFKVDEAIWEAESSLKNYVDALQAQRDDLKREIDSLVNRLVELEA